MLRDGAQLISRSRGRDHALVPRAGATFGPRGLPAEVAVSFSGAAPARRMDLITRGRTEPYEEIVPVTPAAAELAACAGRYRSDELATEWTVAVERGGLVARGRTLDAPMAPVSRDAFFSQELGAIVTFTRDDKGAIDGFDLGRGKPRGLRFERLK